MDERLELQDIFNLIRKRAGMILLITLGAVILAGLISYYMMTPVYQGTTQILVSQDIGGGEGLSEQNVQIDQQLVSTYSELIESPVILDRVIDELNLNVTAEELDDHFFIKVNEESQLIEITVEDANQRKAVDVVNTTAAIFKEEVQNILGVNNVKILFEAEVADNAEPISPSPSLNMAIGGALGLVLGVGLAFLLSYLDTSIKNERDVEQYLGVPVLAVISPVKENFQDEKAAKAVLQEKEA